MSRFFKPFGALSALFLLAGCQMAVSDEGLNPGDTPVDGALNPGDQDGDGHFEDDCDDTNANIHPGAEESCYDGVDSDCDGNGATDEADCVEQFADADGDGYCSTAPCAAAGMQAGDCNDGNASIHPGATETCNGVDDNCDGDEDEVEEWVSVWLNPANGATCAGGDGNPTTSVSIYGDRIGCFVAEDGNSYDWPFQAACDNSSSTITGAENAYLVRDEGCTFIRQVNPSYPTNGVCYLVYRAGVTNPVWLPGD